jgi:hypothetical protein
MDIRVAISKLAFSSAPTITIDIKDVTQEELEDVMPTISVSSERLVNCIMGRNIDVGQDNVEELRGE